MRGGQVEKFRLGILGFDQKITSEIQSIVHNSNLFLETTYIEEQENNLGEFKYKLTEKVDIIIYNTIGYRTGTPEAINIIKDQSPLTEVILVTFGPHYGNAIRAFRQGARDVLIYPFSEREMTFSFERAITYLTLYKRSDSLGSILGLLNRFGDSRKFQDELELLEGLNHYLRDQWGAGPIGIVLKDKEGVVGPLPNHPQSQQFFDEGKAWMTQYPWPQLDNHVFPFTKITQVGKIWIAVALGRVPSGEEAIGIFPLGNKVPEQEILGYLTRLLQTSFQYLVFGKSEKEFMNLAHTDDVTGLLNQRKLNLDLDMAIKLYHREKKIFSVIFIDIDHFKKVNDGHGHLSGSLLLTEMAKVLKKVMRENDSLYRYGGDEFVGLLSGANSEQAKEIGLRVLKAVKSHVFSGHHGAQLKLSVSIGISEFPVHAQSKQDILDKADQMMYFAKEKGRGKVAIDNQFFEES